MRAPGEKEAARLAELRKFEFLYEESREDLQRLCDVTRQAFGSARAFICLAWATWAVVFAGMCVKLVRRYVLNSAFR